MHEEGFETLCNTDDGVFIVNADKHIVRWNKGAERVLKFTEPDVLNQECYRILAGQASVNKIHCSPDCSIHCGVLAGACQKNLDLLTHTKDGAPLWLNISFISPRNGDSPFLAHILRDVTQEKNTEQALNRFLADLDARNLVRKKMGEKSAKSNSISNEQSAALSDREIEVLTLLAEGLPTNNLAQRLNISHFTARNHIQNILVKLDLHSKAQAVSYAFKKGIL
jgi:DNA-binding CsgD family transcriptional regulator